MYLEILNVVIFVTNGKWSISTLKISLSPKPKGGFNPPKPHYLRHRHCL